jgi:hypothetical protein
MFVTPHGKESINALAQQIGCRAGECGVERGYGKPALTGNTFGIKEQIKAAGARWDSTDKAWTFSSWEDLEAFLTSTVTE